MNALFNAAAAKSDLEQLDVQIRLTDQIIARLMELTHRRKIHRANLVLAKGKLATALTIDMLDNGRDYDRPVPLATSRKISFTPDEREVFYAGLARHCSGPTLDPSTSQLSSGFTDADTLGLRTGQLPRDFIDRDHDGHG